ncbi:MAG TPA: hypothetical protein VN841_28260 [Bryobacteraceae bacterium]|nr:hypothetical protein [Bryobacteraceae bacterium]
MAAGAWYMYPILQKHEAGIARLPDMQKAVDTLQDEVKSAGSKFDEWTANQKTFSDRTEQALRDLRGRMDAVKEEAKAEAGEAAAALTERVQGEFGVKIDKIQTQLAELGSGQAADQQRIASLERDAIEAREQANREAQDLAALQRRIEEQDALNQRQVADVTDLKQTERLNRRDFDALNDKLAVERVDFEASKNRQRDLAPGITLTVTGIDEQYRRATGWVWLVADRRTIWFRNHGAQEPVEFYSTTDGKKRELVITHLAKDSVAGYLLLPKAAGTTAHTPAAD